MISKCLYNKPMNSNSNTDHLNTVEDDFLYLQRDQPLSLFPGMNYEANQEFQWDPHDAEWLPVPLYTNLNEIYNENTGDTSVQSLILRHMNTWDPFSLEKRLSKLHELSQSGRLKPTSYQTYETFRRDLLAELCANRKHQADVEFHRNLAALEEVSKEDLGGTIPAMQPDTSITCWDEDSL